MKTTISKTQLVPLLIKSGFIEDAKAVDYEAYGRKVMAYIHVKDMTVRRSLEQFLGGEGLKVNTSYWPGAAVVEVQVSYFKARNWDV
jgi:hypothetical protein